MSQKKEKQKSKKAYWNKPLNDDAPAKRKIQVVNYDADGNKLGDDGYPMTQVRKMLHNLLNIYFVGGLAIALFALFCCVFSYFQGQEYSYIELVATGGTQLNGWDFAFLLRIEALFCLFVAIISICINLVGFNWMYDDRAPYAYYALLAILGIASMAFFIAVNLFVGVSEPISAISLLFTLLNCICTFLVASEKPTLRKPKIAKTEVM
ncbi:MAG: hypothetical protein Q4A43_03320 [Coriobacteriia bacterium]|nr:hypothetical protein [Coriobacteriia bacterium]